MRRKYSMWRGVVCYGVCGKIDNFPEYFRLNILYGKSHAEPGTQILEFHLDMK